MASEAPRPQVPQIIPETLLEKKRYLLAGRRRGLRIRNRGSWDREMEHFRDAVLQASQETRTSSFPQDSISIVREEEKLRSLERELVVDAYSHDDPDVHVEDGWVIAEVKGFMEPIKFPLSEIEKEVKVSLSISHRGTHPKLTFSLLLHRADERRRGLSQDCDDATCELRSLAR